MDRTLRLRILGDDRSALDAIFAVGAGGDKIDAMRPTLHIGADLPTGALEGLRAEVDALTAQAKDIHLGLDLDTGDLAKLAALNASLVTLSERLARSPISKTNFARSQAEMMSVAAGLEKIGRMHEEPTIDVRVDMPADLTTKMGGFFATHALQTLFSGGLWTLTAWHYIIDGFVELAAVVVPATLALAAFGAAAYHTFDLIGLHMKAVYTAATATGTVIPPMSHAFAALEASVRPDAFQLFGDAIQLATAKSSAFSDMAQTAGHIVDDWAARIVVDMTSGKGAIGSMAAQSGNDLNILGGIFASLGGAFGNLLKAAQVTHIAEILFGIIGGAAKLLDLFTQLPTPILAAIVGIHGMWVWGRLLLGVFSTFGQWMIRPWIGMAGAVFTAGARMGIFRETALGVANSLGVAFPVLDRMHGNMEAFATDAEKSGRATAVWHGALDLLSAVPVWGWVAAGVVVVGALAYALSRVKTATEQWLSSLQAGLMKQPIDQSLTTLYNDLDRVTSGLVSTQGKLRAIWAASDRTNSDYQKQLDRYRASTVQLENSLVTLTSGQRQLADQGNLLTYRLGLLSSKFGMSLPDTMAIATLAGVKMTDMLNKQKSSLVLIETEIGGIIAGYKAMGQSTGMIGQDINAIAYAGSDQLAAMQKLNQAWDTYIGNITATQNTFDTAAIGMKTLANSAAETRVAIGHSHITITGFGHAIDGLSQKDLALNQAFQGQVVSLNGMIDAWRTAGLTSGQFTNGVKAAVAIMLPYARGSKEATAMLSALAQEANGPATDSFQVLSKWVGNMHDPMKVLKGDSINAALGMDSLRAQAEKLSTSLSQDLNAMIQRTILSSSNVQQAMSAYSQVLKNNQQDTEAGHDARQTLFNDLMAVTHSAPEANQAIKLLTAGTKGLGAAIGGLQSKNIVIDVNGKAQYAIVGPGVAAVQGGGHRVAAAGWLVPGYGGGDRWPAMLEGGEAVVPKHLVPMVAPFLRHHGVPGFAQGGLMSFSVGGSGVSGLASGVTAFDKSVQQDMINGLVGAMRHAIAAFTNAFSNAMSGPAMHGGSSAAMQFARGLMGSYGWGRQWPSLYALWQRESGWNSYAVNLSSGAYGIPQALGHGHPFKLGDYANQIRWGLSYIASRYGSPNAAWAHEVATGWYDRGGLLMPGLTLAYNGTGIPEVVSRLHSAPTGGRYAGGGGDIYNIYVKGDTNPDAAALAIIQKVRDYKRHHGNQPTGIG